MHGNNYQPHKNFVRVQSYHGHNKRVTILKRNRPKSLLSCIQWRYVFMGSIEFLG